mmetsp:Transcript_3827/g.11314  ORF Transcript_3827/g.11314 Transcript_3827/m.11314 type:complete len:113 (-) Transcript_3827:953-1291(-)
MHALSYLDVRDPFDLGLGLALAVLVVVHDPLRVDATASEGPMPYCRATGIYRGAENKVRRRLGVESPSAPCAPAPAAHVHGFRAPSEEVRHRSVVCTVVRVGVSSGRGCADE